MSGRERSGRANSRCVVAQQVSVYMKYRMFDKIIVVI